MLSPLQSPFQDPFLNTHTGDTLSATQRFIRIYLRPLALATAVTTLMSIVVCFVFIMLAGNPAQTSIPQTEQDLSLAQRSATQQNNVTAFLETIRQAYGNAYNATAGGTFATVQLTHNTLYRIQRQSTYQEVATTNDSLRQQITRLLDAQGIEYEVFKNNGDAVLLTKGEWIISWGGILYCPQIAASL